MREQSLGIITCMQSPCRLATPAPWMICSGCMGLLQEGGAPGPSRKRDAPDAAPAGEEEDLPDEVRQRLSALRDGGGLD